MKDLNFNEGDISAFRKVLENAFDVKPSKHEESTANTGTYIRITQNGEGKLVEANGSFLDLMNMLGALIVNLANNAFKDSWANKIIMLEYLAHVIKELKEEDEA